MSKLRNQEGVGARAFEFVVLTAARTGEVIGAKWSEVDFVNKVWNVPAERMKARRPHKVPLSIPAIRVLESMFQIRQSDFIFPGAREMKSLSNMACLAVLERMGRVDLTVHGFRSTFRDWAAECTSSPREVVEAALAHTISDKVEAAYRRGDLLNKRRKLMDAWSQHCEPSRQPVPDYPTTISLGAAPAVIIGKQLPIYTTSPAELRWMPNGTTWSLGIGPRACWTPLSVDRARKNDEGAVRIATPAYSISAGEPEQS